MPLHYGLVAASGAIVAQDKPLPPVTKQTITKLVENLPKHDSKVSYKISADTYHCLVENGILYICISDDNTQARTAYGMLTEAKEEFKQQFGSGGGRYYPKPVDVSPQRCQKFGVTLAAKLRYFNENPQGDKIGKLKNQIEDVKQVMLTNIDEIMERGQRIDSLVDKSETLVEQAADFEDNSRTLKRVMICRNLKIIGLFALILFVIIFIIVLIACKPNFSNCKSDDPAPAPAPPAGATTTTTSTTSTTTSTSTSTTTTTTTTTPTTTTSTTTTSTTTATTTTDTPTTTPEPTA